MTETVLVTYASRHHATAEIAAEIAKALEDSGLKVDVAPVDRIVSVKAYCAVIAGSAIYDGEWLPNGMQFLTDHVAQLETIPTWFFSSGPLARPHDADKPAELPATLTTLRTRIKPRDTVVFGGRLEPHHLSLAEWLSHPEIRHVHGDFRDWADIRTWAEGVARTLQQGRVLPADGSSNARQ